MSLPSGYTHVEYIESNGKQYIDTGINGNNDNLTISVRFNMLAFSSYRGVFGNYKGEDYNCYRLILTDNDNNKYYVNHNTAGGGGTTTLANLLHNTINEVVVKADEVIVNGVSIAYTSNTKKTDNDTNIGIFSNRAGLSSPSTMRLYEFKIADNGILVRNFVPCIDPSGTAGLYDVVNGAFYGSSSTGTFTAGNPVIRLPVGYTELEWIRSDGGQYIDTGVIVDYQSRLIMEAQMDAVQSGATTQYAAYGAGTTNWYFWFTPTLTTYYRIYARRQKIFTAACNSFERFYFELDGGEATFTIGGVTETASLAVSTANSGYPLYLFAMNVQGTTSYQSRMWLWSFKMYANGVLVRDFVPCKNPSGEVGLYDKVNYVFYQNQGTGTFAAGPVKSLTPDAPENLTAEIASGAVILSWTASEDAAGYRVYRNGELLAQTAGTTYSDTDVPMYREHEYTVIPYNEHGGGGAAVLSVFAKNLRPLDDLITDRTAEDVANRTAKGAYNAVDLNRVTAAAEYVHDMLGELGYAVADQTGRAWLTNDIPDRSEMNAHHSAVVGLDVIAYAHEKIELPPNLEKLTYTGANDIEMFLLLCGEAAERIPEGYIYSNEIHGGEL